MLAAGELVVQRRAGLVALLIDGGVLLVVVGVVDVGLGVESAAGVDHRASGIGSLGGAIGHLKGQLAQTVVGLAPDLIVGAPAHDARRAEVALHHLQPLAQEDAHGVGTGGIDSPAGHLAPAEVTEPVGPVQETLLEHLLMQPRAVEAHGHGQLDVAAQRVVGGRGVDAVGIEALIQHQPLEYRRTVDQALLAVKGDRAQGKIAVHRVDGFAVFQQRQLQVVEVALTRRPEVNVIDLQRQAGVMAVGQALGGSLGRAVEGGLGAQGQAGTGAVDRRVDVHAAVGGVGDQLCGAEVGLGNPLQPDGLPDARGAGVAATEGMIARALLAEGLTAAAQVVVGADHQRVFAGNQRVGDFEGEGGVAALVHAHGLAVDPCLAAVVHRAEVQQHALTGGVLRQREAAAVPHRGHEVLAAYAGELALGAEGHENGSVQRRFFHKTALAARRAVVDFKLPCAV